MPKWICSWLPYLHKDLWGIGKSLHKSGYAEEKTSRGIAWGFGHPMWGMDFEKGIFVCERCGVIRDF